MRVEKSGPQDGPAPCPMGRLIPLEPKDQWKPVANIRSLLFLVVRQQLDQNVMQDALDRLIRNHLPILGARLERQGRKKMLVYRLPDPFPDQYDLFRWSAESLSSSLDTARLLPAKMPADGGERVFMGPASVREMEAQWIPTDWPVERNHEKPGTPLLLVHITSYTDATIVALNLPHAVADQMGYGSLIRAWMDLADGREPAPFVEPQTGRFDGQTSISSQELRRKGCFRIMGRLEKLVLMANLISQLAKEPKEEHRTVFIPESVVDELRCRLDKAIKAEYGDVSTITNGDVIASILAKFAHLERKSRRNISFSSAINVRGRHPALPEGQPYLHNCLGFAISHMRVSGTTPLYEFAYQHRLAVDEGINLDKFERSFGVMRELCRRGCRPSMSEPCELIYSVTNWCRAWRNIDLGPAIPVSAAESGCKANAVPLIFGHSAVRGHPARFTSQVMSRSPGQGYWCGFSASTKQMARIEKRIESDPRLSTL